MFQCLRPTKPHSLSAIFDRVVAAICNPLKDLPCNQYDRRRSRSRSTPNCSRSNSTNPRSCRCSNSRRRAKADKFGLHTPRLIIQFCSLRYARIITGEVSPVNPLKEVCNKDDRRRTRSRATPNCSRSNSTNPRSRRCTNSRRRAKFFPTTNNIRNPRNM